MFESWLEPDAHALSRL